jgi:hypothetical protein
MQRSLIVSELIPRRGRRTVRGRICLNAFEGGCMSGHMGGPRGILTSGFATLPLLVGGFVVSCVKRLWAR